MYILSDIPVVLFLNYNEMNFNLVNFPFGSFVRIWHVNRRQILTSIDGPRNERIKQIILTSDP